MKVGDLVKVKDGLAYDSFEKEHGLLGLIVGDRAGTTGAGMHARVTVIFQVLMGGDVFSWREDHLEIVNESR